MLKLGTAQSSFIILLGVLCQLAVGGGRRRERVEGLWRVEYVVTTIVDLLACKYLVTELTVSQTNWRRH